MNGKRSASPTQASQELDWRFTQVFEDKSQAEEATEEDMISAIEFDNTGNLLAIGDRGGRVVIIKRQENAASSSSTSGRRGDYKLYTEFQSHDPEFDYLKSLDIEEKINQIKWCKQKNNAHFLLTTNDKTIKLWKVYEKKVKRMFSTNSEGRNGLTLPVTELQVPKVKVEKSVIASTNRRVYANAHAYHINSISLNSDGETFLSADDLRVNLWNLEIPDQSFNIVDIKPDNMEELTEVITAACFHPDQCNLFMYSSSRGTIKLADMRTNALCDRHAKMFEQEEDPSNRNFFSEIISSVSDIKFSRCGRYILSRDYLTLKLWDINMENKPLRVIPVHDHLKPHLCDLYENDCIFDKFECVSSGDGMYLMTGSYNNMFYIYDKNGKLANSIEASKSVPKRKPSAKGRQVAKRTPKKTIPYDQIDFTKKVLHMQWHPEEPVIAVASLNNLYIYDASSSQ